MADSRKVAHEALRSLWDVANERLLEPDASEREGRSIPMREVETSLGARIESFGGRLSISVEFDKHDGTGETVEILFAEDIRDLSDSEVSVDWSNEHGSGTNTPPLRDYPKIAQEILALI